MKLKAVSGMMLTLLVVGMLTLAFNIEPVRAGTIIVPDDYPTIQAAINAANLGDIIYVKEGTYYENVVVNKTVSLIGENRSTTIIDGKFGTGFRVISNYVNISGFTIRNCGPPEGGPFGGIHLDSSHNCKVSENTINNSYIGILPNAGSSNFIFNNTFSNCHYAIGGPFVSGNNLNIFNNLISDNAAGIYLDESSNSIISNNTLLNGQRLSIFLRLCSNITLTNNNMTGNIYSLKVFAAALSHFIHDIDVSNTVDGKPVYYLINQRNLIIDPLTFPDVGYLGLVNSTNIIIKNLNITRSGQGVLLAHTTRSTVTHLNTSFNFHGIDIFSSSNNTITDNTITSNYYSGIVLCWSDSNIICCNTLSNNAYCIEGSWSSGNTIYHNNFINNTEQAPQLIDGTNTWDNGAGEGNYWSDYQGVDDGSGGRVAGDGVGDTMLPHQGVDYYPLMNPWSPPPSYTLTIYSSPTGVTFTVDGVSHTTPWSRTYSEGASVNLVMPYTHDGYIWSHWLEDGDPNRVKTVTMDTNITLTAVFTPGPPPVGGKAIPIDKPIIKPELQIPWIWLSTIILSLVLTVVYVKKRKRNREINS